VQLTATFLAGAPHLVDRSMAASTVGNGLLGWASAAALDFRDETDRAWGPTVERTALERATDIFKAPSNPLRVGFVRELAAGDRAVHQLVDALGVAQPRVSEHLAILRGARLVEARRVGRSVTDHLVDSHVAHIVEDAVLHATEIG
jgi:ArsR family transcriptional regulator, zinc-responsive transcriptional repressor